MKPASQITRMVIKLLVFKPPGKVEWQVKMDKVQEKGSINPALQINTVLLYFQIIFVGQIADKNIDGSHEAAMFGAGNSVPETTTLSTVTEVKTTPPVISQSNDKEGLFASWVSVCCKIRL